MNEKKKGKAADKFNNVIVGQKIRAIRQKHKLTMEELAEKSNITSNYLSRIELGKGTPRLPILVDIANALNIGVDYLLADNLNINKENTLNADVYINEQLTKLNLKQKETVALIINSYLDN